MAVNEFSGLDEILASMDAAVRELPQIRYALLEDLATETLARVMQYIGGSGDISGHQKLHYGRKKGYIAIRADRQEYKRGKTYAKPWSYYQITNAIENGHAIRRPSGKAKKYKQARERLYVPGGYMYRATAEQMDMEASMVAGQVERRMLAILNGESI